MDRVKYHEKNMIRKWTNSKVIFVYIFSLYLHCVKLCTETSLHLCKLIRERCKNNTHFILERMKLRLRNLQFIKEGIGRNWEICKFSKTKISWVRCICWWWCTWNRWRWWWWIVRWRWCIRFWWRRSCLLRLTGGVCEGVII